MKKYPLFTLEDAKKLAVLARRRARSRTDYYQFQKFQGELLIRFLKNYGINFDGRLILDIGCGHGGYSGAIQAAGAHCVGIDLSPKPNPDQAEMIVGNALRLPFQENCFEGVVCANLIEHVPDPEALLAECVRVVKPGGWLYVGYPPFYSPVGGHQFAPFHLLGEKLSLTLYQQRLKLQRRTDFQRHILSEEPTDFSQAFTNFGLYPLTIARVRKGLQNLPVSFIKQATRYSMINFSRIPLIGEFLTLHVQFLVQKNK